MGNAYLGNGDRLFRASLILTIADHFAVSYGPNADQGPMRAYLISGPPSGSSRSIDGYGHLPGELPNLIESRGQVSARRLSRAHCFGVRIFVSTRRSKISPIDRSRLKASRSGR